MISPFTGKEMKKVYEERTWNFRGETYKYVHTAWLCEDTKEQFTDDAGDTAGFIQVTNQYREKYGIPYTDEIIAIRKKYGISASKMSLILGIGVNQYRLYEQGEVPSVSNGRMIRSIMNPKVMLDMVNSSRKELSESDYDKIVGKVSDIIANSELYKVEKYETSRVFCTGRGEENGYAQVSLNKLKNTILYILERCSNVWCTKMNKLLFYADFMSYRETGSAMTGLVYKAIELGPVPERWDRVYSEFADIRQELRQCGNYEGSVLVSDKKADTSVFSDMELKVLDTVCAQLGSYTAKEISVLSHKECAWEHYYNQQGRIPFSAAFSLKAV
ncbi:MAG: DUF4065 domain-containing protein [Paludibacteraceae bacterium]|nr:DUF4065 domain-containing protein [Paludibacteraceae bacterium]MBQ2065848.1 DUF4065 domain-containing protein [Paludibacteraceae bacterium]